MVTPPRTLPPFEAGGMHNAAKRSGFFERIRDRLRALRARRPKKH